MIQKTHKDKNKYKLDIGWSISVVITFIKLRLITKRLITKQLRLSIKKHVKYFIFQRLSHLPSCYVFDTKLIKLKAEILAKTPVQY